LHWRGPTWMRRRRQCEMKQEIKIGHPKWLWLWLHWGRGWSRWHFGIDLEILGLLNIDVTFRGGDIDVPFKDRPRRIGDVA